MSTSHWNSAQENSHAHNEIHSYYLFDRLILISSRYCDVWRTVRKSEQRKRSNTIHRLTFWVYYDRTYFKSIFYTIGVYSIAEYIFIFLDIFKESKLTNGNAINQPVISCPLCLAVWTHSSTTKEIVHMSCTQWKITG